MDRPYKKIPARSGGKAPANNVTAKKGYVRTPLSVLIPGRIEAHKARFHANDSISKFIQPG